MISVTDAIKTILENTQKDHNIKYVPLFEVLPKSVVAKDIVAPTDVPSFRASIVDGYAVIHNECPGTFDVKHVIHTAGPTDVSLSPKTVVRVTTGAPIPTNCTAVIPVEETVLRSQSEQGEELTIEILAKDVSENDNIRAIGSDSKCGDVIIPQGYQIGLSGAEIGLCSSVGLREIPVIASPGVAVMSTGDEVTDVTGELKSRSSIFDANRPALLRALRSESFDVQDEGIVNDDADAIAHKIKSVLLDSDSIDVLITTGGVSMGETDFLKSVIERKLNGTIHFGRVNMKPGKPTTFATFQQNNRRKLIFCLPGNPASALVTFYLFVLPALKKLANRSKGESNFSLPLVYPELSEDVRLDGVRPEYQRAVVEVSSSGLKATTTGFQRSSHIASLVGANALLQLPSAKEAGKSTIIKGTQVAALLFGNL
jgi:gephyrin